MRNIHQHLQKVHSSTISPPNEEYQANPEENEQDEVDEEDAVLATMKKTLDERYGECRSRKRDSISSLDGEQERYLETLCQAAKSYLWNEDGAGKKNSRSALKIFLSWIRNHTARVRP